MPGIEDLDKAIERLEAAEQRAREAAADANGAAKDLNHLIAEVKRIVHNEVVDIIEQTMITQVDIQLKDLERITKNHIDLAARKITGEFKVFEDMIKDLNNIAKKRLDK